MSTILKALRRLEREKQPEPGKPLRDDVVALSPADPTQPHPDRALWWTGGVGAAVALVLGGLWLASGVREAREARAEAAASTAIARPAPPVQAIPQARPPAEPATRGRGPGPDVAPPRTQDAPQRARSAPPVPREPAPSAVERRPRPVVRKPEPSEPVAELPHRLPDPEPLHAFEAPPLRAPAPEAAPVPELEVELVKPAVKLRATPAPEAHVDSTTWHPDASRRLAVVSAAGGQPVTLHEGDAIGELVVLRIEPAAVVFLYQGRELSRRVGD